MFSMGLGQKNVNKNKIVPFEIPSILRLILARGHRNPRTYSEIAIIK